MTWIAFASVPTILVAMLAMGQLEARLLPQSSLPRDGDDDRADADRTAANGRGAIGAGSHGTGHWEVVLGPVDGREEART
jgi:hypothetical protein